MQNPQIKTIIEKYKELADFTHSDTKCYQYDRFAEYLEENIPLFENDDYENEEDILELFNESESEFDDTWEKMLPVGNDKDSIAKFIEEEIYHFITNSAKTRFDFDLFEESFLELNENVNVDVADKILWLIIMNLAAGDNPQIVALKIQNELLLAGFTISDFSDFEKMITDNTFFWSKEVGVLQMVTYMLNSNFAPVQEIYNFVLGLFEEDYSIKGVIVPWFFRRELDKYMDKFKDKLDSYKLFFLPDDKLSLQGWNAVYLDCEKHYEKSVMNDSILLQIHFNHSENLVLIQNIMVFGIFQITGTRMKLISLLLDICLLIKYRLIFVQIGETFHEKLIRRGATDIDFETVEITKSTNLDPNFPDEC